MADIEQSGDVQLHLCEHGAPDAGPPDAGPTCPPRAFSPDAFFTFYSPQACNHRYDDLELRVRALGARADVSVGLSFRLFGRHRCVPMSARRDGFIHVLVGGEELVFGVTRPPNGGSIDSSELVLIARFASDQTSATAQACPPAAH